MLKPTYNKETKVWSGPKIPSLYNPDQNLGQLICRVLEQTPDLITQISADTNVSVTCAEMRDRILKFARHLSESGYEQGDIIGIIAGNSENLAPAVFACFVLGLAVNPLSPIMNESDIIQMYSKTKPKLIICDANILKTVQNAVNSMKSDAKIYTLMDKINNYDCVTEIINKITSINDFIYPDVDPNSTLIIICSSGSTGEPKGICKSHKEVISSIFSLYSENLDQTPVFFLVTQLFWFSGFFLLIQTTLSKYKRVITSQPFNLKHFIDTMSDHKVNFIMTAPFTLVKFLESGELKQLSDIKCWVIAGSVCQKDLFDKFQPFIPNGKLCNGYACSEENVIAINYEDKYHESVGYPLQNVQVKIADDDGKALNNFEQGEIYIKVAVQFNGYLNEQEKTKEAFDGEFFKTGDVGYFNDEGFLYVCERKKEMLKYQGFQITPAEIESVINEIKGVVSSCVIGIFDPINSNDIIHAFVIKNESSELTENFILDYVNERVIDQKKIRGGVHFVKSFPLGLTGKVDRKKMRAYAEEIMKK